MRQVTGAMGNVVKGMDQAMKSMDLEKVSTKGACVQNHAGMRGIGLYIIGWMGEERDADKIS
jgi:hypothetical protein